MYNELLKRLKISLQIQEEDSTFDTLLLEIIKKCQSVIKLWCGINTLIPELEDILLLIAVDLFNKIGEEGISTDEISYRKILDEYGQLLTRFTDNGLRDNSQNPTNSNARKMRVF